MGGKMTGDVKHPRAEVEAVLVKIQEMIEDELPVLVIAAGSYRRGCESLGDLDVVILLQEEPSAGKILKAFGIPPLTKSGKPRSGGSVVIDGVQVDVSLCKLESLGACLMHVTGPPALNIVHRRAAKEKGYLLNQHGIFVSCKAGEEPDYVIRSGKNGGQKYCRVPGSETEKQIYELLGLTYLTPEEREVWHGKR